MAVTSKVTATITKVDDDKRLVFGWANVPIPGDRSLKKDMGDGEDMMDGGEDMPGMAVRTDEDSMEWRMRTIQEAYYAKYTTPESWAWVIETYDSFVIGCQESWADGVVKCKYFKHAYVMEDDSVAFGEGTEVEQAWVTKQLSEYERWVAKLGSDNAEELSKRLLEAYRERAEETRKAATPKVDYQGDIVPSDELEHAAYLFVMESRTGSVNHTGEVVSEMVESFYATEEKYLKMGVPADVAKGLHEGWWIGFYVHDDEVWKGVKDGTYSMFSIGGRAYRDEINP